MLGQRQELFHCEVAERAFCMVGMHITAEFPSGFPDAALKIQRRFGERRHEIPNAISREVLFSPYMCNGLFATYFACLEVDEIGGNADIPEGMMAIRLPLMPYAKISCTTKTIGEAYNRIFPWMKEQGYKQRFLDQSCPIEIYYFDERAEEEPVEIWIPIR